MSARIDTLPCGTQRALLHRWFDGDLLDEAIAVHMRDCTHCTAELEVLEGQRDAIAGLSGQPRGAEATLDCSRRAAEATLADLLAELAEACLPASSARSSRPWGVVRAEITLLATRVSQLGACIDLAELPDREPAPSEGATFALRCVKALVALEGGRNARNDALSQRCAEQGGEA
jgi:hypothetical protein